MVVLPMSNYRMKDYLIQILQVGSLILISPQMQRQLLDFETLFFILLQIHLSLPIS